jgi:hypothetical protein
MLHASSTYTSNPLQTAPKQHIYRHFGKTSVGDNRFQSISNPITFVPIFLKNCKTFFHCFAQFVVTLW